MTTKYETGLFHHNHKGYMVERQRTLVAELPDEEGVFETSLGRLKQSFEVNSLGHKFVVLEIGEIYELQTHDRRKIRRVNVSNKGVGQTNISRGRILYVSTDAFNKGGEGK